jgi:hypothetical protein
MDCMRSPFALADPVPFTVAILKAKSFTRVIFHASAVAAYRPQWRSIDLLVLDRTIPFEAACIQEGVCLPGIAGARSARRGLWRRYSNVIACAGAAALSVLENF